MPRAYSVDLRERSLRALTSGMPAAEVAHLFDVSEASLYRWHRRQRERGDLVPDRPPGRPPRLDVAARDALRAQVATHPEATLAEHCAPWAAEHGTWVSPATMCRTLARLGLPRKKRR